MLYSSILIFQSVCLAVLHGTVLSVPNPKTDLSLVALLLVATCQGVSDTLTSSLMSTSITKLLHPDDVGPAFAVRILFQGNINALGCALCGFFDPRIFSVVSICLIPVAAASMMRFWFCFEPKGTRGEAK